MSDILSKVRLKIIMLGSSAVGKTSLIRRFAEGNFCENYHASTLIDVKLMEATYRGRAVNLAIWDTAGQERFQALLPQYLRNVHKAVLVYDVTNRQSFKNVVQYLRLLEAKEIREGENYPVVIIVGTKIDLELQRDVSKREGRDFAQRHKAIFVETSAKDNYGVSGAFEDLVYKIVETPNLWQDNADRGSVINLDHGWPIRRRTGPNVPQRLQLTRWLKC